VENKLELFESVAGRRHCRRLNLNCALAADHSVPCRYRKGLRSYGQSAGETTELDFAIALDGE